MLQDQVVVVAGLEEVNQLNNVGVLAHFEDFNLLPLLKNLYGLHVGFCNQLHSNQGLGLDVLAELNHTELAFAQLCGNFIKVTHVFNTSDFMQAL